MCLHSQTPPLHLAPRDSHPETCPQANMVRPFPEPTCPFSHPRHSEASFPGLTKQAQRGADSPEASCPWLMDELPLDLYGSESHPGPGGSWASAQHRGRRRTHFYPPSVLRRAPDAPATKPPREDSQPQHRTLHRKHDGLGTPGLQQHAHHACSSGRPTYTWGPSKGVFFQLGHPRKWGLAYRVQQINRGLVYRTAGTSRTT